MSNCNVNSVSIDPQRVSYWNKNTFLSKSEVKLKYAIEKESDLCKIVLIHNIIIKCKYMYMQKEIIPKRKLEHESEYVLNIKLPRLA